MTDNIDLTSKVITFLFKIPGEKSMDLRIAMALLEKVVIFLLFFIGYGESRFSFFDYSLSLIGWLIMHIHIVINELGYIRFGYNDLKLRYYWFKVADFLQMSIVVIYFAVSIHVDELLTPMNSFVLYVALIDQGMNVTQFVQLGDIKPPKGEQAINYQGGMALFFFGATVGSGFSQYIASTLLRYAQKRKDQQFPFYPAFLWCGIIGEVAFIVYSTLCLTKEIKKNTKALTTIQSVSETSKYKYLLSFSYGLCIGVFNIYYAIIVGMYCIFKVAQFLYKCYEDCKKPDRRVRPI